MTDHPMLFSAPMVRALLEGRKTQTRRILKPQPFSSWCYQGFNVYGDALFYPNGSNDEENEAAYENWDGIAKLKYKIGDRLWVREAWRAHAEHDSLTPRDIPPGSPVQYIADDPLSPWDSKTRPSMFMPRWASRLTLVVTDVRVQRLQDISRADAIAEGATSKENLRGYNDSEPGWAMDWNRVGEKSKYSPGGILTERCICLPDAQMAFANFWTRINGSGAWAANPWVVAVSFTVHKCNIDRMAA